MSKAHNIALKSFNANHASYDTFRPSFGPKLVDRFLADLNLASNGKYHNEKRILELAAGTGKFTKNLVNNGWSDNLVVVEPSSGMLKSFRQNFPSIKQVYEGSSYKIPVEDNSVDSVVVAQGFHWFSDETSLQEIRRVLKPSGTLGLIWNFDAPMVESLVSLEEKLPTYEMLYDEGSIPADVIEKSQTAFEKVPQSKEKAFAVATDFFNKHLWSTTVAKYIYSYDVNVPQYRHGKWRKCLHDTELFDPIAKESILLYNLFDRAEDVYKYWETRSYITDLSEEERMSIKKTLEDILQKEARERDFKDGALIKPMGCHAVVVKVRK